MATATVCNKFGVYLRFHIAIQWSFILDCFSHVSVIKFIIVCIPLAELIAHPFQWNTFRCRHRACMKICPLQKSYVEIGMFHLFHWWTFNFVSKTISQINQTMFAYILLKLVVLLLCSLHDHWLAIYVTTHSAAISLPLSNYKQNTNRGRFLNGLCSACHKSDYHLRLLVTKMPVSWNLAADVERFLKHSVKSNSKKYTKSYWL